MIDGLRSEDLKYEDGSFSDDLTVADLISGNNVAIAGSYVGVGMNVTTATADGKLLSAIGVGSPALVYGKLAIAGVGATGAGSNVWHVFPTAFSAAPTSLLVNSIETSEVIFAPTGSWAAGSFYVETVSASQAFSWAAFE